MKLLFIMDPLARIQIAGDSTFALMLSAQQRRHEIWFCEPRHLGLEHDEPMARAWPVTVRRIVGDHYLLGPQASVPLGSCHAVFMRKDPPIDLDYYFATLLLERARGRTLSINDPRGLRECNEKLAILNYPHLCPPTIVTRETVRLRSFLLEQGGEMVVKPLDASGGFGVFHVRQGDTNTGAILEQAMMDIMFEVPSVGSAIREVVINEDTIQKGAQPILMYQKGVAVAGDRSA